MGAAGPRSCPRRAGPRPEGTFDPRPFDRAAHRAVELAAPAERDRRGARSEVGHQTGEDFIALLPVAARNVELERRLIAPVGVAFKRYVRALGRKAARLDVDAVRPVAVGHLALDRHMVGTDHRRERSPLAKIVILAAVQRRA